MTTYCAEITSSYGGFATCGMTAGVKITLIEEFPGAGSYQGGSLTMSNSGGWMIYDSCTSTASNYNGSGPTGSYYLAYSEPAEMYITVTEGLCPSDEDPPIREDCGILPTDDLAEYLDGDWLDQDGSNATLYDKIDEIPVDLNTTDYIEYAGTEADCSYMTVASPLTFDEVGGASVYVTIGGIDGKLTEFYWTCEDDHTIGYWTGTEIFASGPTTISLQLTIQDANAGLWNLASTNFFLVAEGLTTVATGVKIYAISLCATNGSFELMDGGALSGGTAAVSTVDSRSASGGVEVAGIVIPAIGVPASGGIVSAGSAHLTGSTNLAGSGGALAAGRAGMLRVLPELSQGGLLCQGSTTGRLRINLSGSGGLTASGTLGINLHYVNTTGGGVLLSLAAVASVLRSVETSGGVEIAGLSRVSGLKALDSEGGVEISGVTTRYVSRVITAQPGLLVTGDGDTLKESYLAGREGVTVAGLAHAQYLGSVESSEGVTVAGLARHTTTYRPSSEDGVTVAGLTPALMTWQPDSEGGVTVAGLTPAVMTWQPAASGGVVISGLVYPRGHAAVSGELSVTPLIAALVHIESPE